MLHKSHVSILLAVLLVSFSTQAATQKEVDQYLKALKTSTVEGRSWSLLKSIGWSVRGGKSEASKITLKAGAPMKLNSFGDLPSKDCTVLCIDVPKSVELQAGELKSSIESAIASKASAEAFRLKLSAQVETATTDIKGAFGWPEDHVDALGTGFQPQFSRINIALKELEKSGAIEKGEYDSVDEAIPADEQSHYASWGLSKGTKPSKAVESLVQQIHTSGCQIALGSLVHRLLHLAYDSAAVFDRAFTDLKINNAFFRPSSLLPKLDYDHSGLQKAKLGVHALKGEAGYIQSIFGEKVDQPDYAGENIMFTAASDEAIKDLIQLKGFGHDPLSEEELEDFDEEELKGNANDPRLERFSGLSGEMIQFWMKFKALKTSTKKSAAQIGDSLRQGELTFSASAAAKKNFTEALKILNRPALNQIRVWGHPAGELSLKDWIITLAEYNPNTPYSIFIYDYGLQTQQWENYKNAHLK